MRNVAILVSLLVSITANTQNIGLNIGDKAPEINMVSPEGSKITLSSLSGQMVLIDFWASWCGPCRRENPTIVAVYNDYKDAKFENSKGFTIYSVSLDKSLISWKEAIKTDKLSWPYHVSDLKGWENLAANVYRVQSIPANVLIDGNGIIIAKNLRGFMLKAKLAELKK